MDKQLKPCPFCGGEPYLNDIYKFQIECFGCGVETRIVDRAEDAIALWNRRRIEQAARTILEEVGFVMKENCDG